MHTPKSSMLLHLIFFDLKENPQRETDSTVNVVSESQNGTVNRNIKGLMLCKDNLPHIFSIEQNDDCEMCLFFNKLTSSHFSNKFSTFLKPLHPFRLCQIKPVFFPPIPSWFISKTAFCFFSTLSCLCLVLSLPFPFFYSLPPPFSLCLIKYSFQVTMISLLYNPSFLRFYVNSSSSHPRGLSQSPWVLLRVVGVWKGSVLDFYCLLLCSLGSVVEVISSHLHPQLQRLMRPNATL